MRLIAGVGLCVLLAGNALAVSPEELLQAAATTIPHPRQVAWQECEFTCFIHFGVNTFTGRAGAGNRRYSDQAGVCLQSGHQRVFFRVV
jgi:hypothetical protein